MVTGHAYPWDVLGDPAFVDRVRGLGVGEVTLAASYHSCRAATPLHPTRQVVDARYAALYRPVRDKAWAGRRLVPRPPDWCPSPDPFAEAAAVLRAAGLRVNAWIVLTHNTRLGNAFPDLAVRDCFGETYPYALCPSHEEVRQYAATLAAEAVRGVPVDGVSLEACGQLGLTHLSHHEKTDGAWSPAASRLLSVCCCAACRTAWRAAGLDDGRLVTALRDAVRALATEPAASGLPEKMPERPEKLLDAEAAQAILATRHASTDALRAAVLAGLPPGVPVTLHASPDPWATGASPGLTPSAATDVDAVLVPAWPTTQKAAEDVAAARQGIGAGRAVGAYVTVLPPAAPEDLPAHVRRLRAAGAEQLHLYHLGLAPAHRLALVPALAAAFDVDGPYLSL